MFESIHEKLIALGWVVENPDIPHVCIKNGARYDLLNDVMESLSGVRVSFADHGEGINVRLRFAEDLASETAL